MARVARASGDGASGRCAVIDPHRGRRARRRPLLGSSTRSPCPTPCHATADAASVLHPWTAPSSTPSATCRGAIAGRSCPTVRLRALSCAGARVQPLRPRAGLLRRGLRRDGAPTVATRRRPALPGQPARALPSCRANPALARAPSGAGHVHVDAGGDLHRAVDSAIGDASGFPIGCLGCCTGRPFIDARRCSNACIGATRPAMQQDRHHQQRGHGGHVGKLGCWRPRADHLADLALLLVPHALRGTRAVGLPAPQPACTPCPPQGGARPWP